MQQRLVQQQAPQQQQQAAGGFTVHYDMSSTDSDSGSDSGPLRVPLKLVVQDAVKRWFNETLSEARRGDVKQQVRSRCSTRPGAGPDWRHALFAVLWVGLDGAAQRLQSVSAGASTWLIRMFLRGAVISQLVVGLPSPRPASSDPAMLLCKRKHLTTTTCLPAAACRCHRLQALLAQMLAEGYGCKQDLEESRRWAERARCRGYQMSGVYCEL